MAKGIVTLAVTPDHITPLYKGGTDTEGNIQCLCEEHHRDKTNRDAGAKVKRRYSEDGWPVDDDGRGAG